MVKYKDISLKTPLVETVKNVYEILIVDDDIDFQDIIGMALQEKGYIINHAYSAHEAEYFLEKKTSFLKSKWKIIWK